MSIFFSFFLLMFLVLNQENIFKKNKENNKKFIKVDIYMKKQNLYL